MASVAVPVERDGRTSWLEVVDSGPREGVYAVRGLASRRLCVGLASCFERKYERNIERAREDKAARLRKEYLRGGRRK